MQAKLSNLQQELLKVYAHNVTEQQLRDIKDMLAQYFAKQAIQEADRVWESKQLSQETMDKWLRE
jgi:hypothetical protein